MTLLEIKDIHKSYYMNKAESKVLKGINLSFDRGEFVSILGESGGGKSTLLNIIGGLDHQYDGELIVDGTSLKNASEKKFDAYRSQTIGFIFQSFNLISHLTNLENVMVPLEMTDLSHKERIAKATALLEQVGLKEHIHKHPNQLSGGQKQRVAIARALAADPDVIIADEPTGALDSQNTAEILEILQKIAEDGKLVIAVTHSQAVADHGTRVVHMVDGQIDYDKQLKPAYPAPTGPVIKKSSPLSFMSAFKMAMQHMRYDIKRNLLIIFGASIGIFSVILMLGLGQGVTGYINDQISSQVNPNTIQIARNLTRKQIEAGEQGNLADKDINRLNKVKNVTKVEKGYYMNGVQVHYQKKSETVQMFQTFNKTERVQDIKTGTKPGANEIILTKAMAEKLDKNYKKMVGRTVTIYVNAISKDQRPVQMRQDVKISGIINSGTEAVTYGTLAKMYQAQGLEFAPNFAAVTVNKTQNVKAVQNKIKTYTSKVNGKTQKDYQITGVGAILDSINTYLMLAFYVLAGIAGISLLVSAIMIIVVLYISVSERTKEIGILRAIGARKKDIRHLFVSEAFLIGLLSSVLGAGIAGLGQSLVNTLAQPLTHMPIVAITSGYVLFGIIISIIISLLAALAPSRKAAKLDPIEALAAE
ncbi:ATP-binding cassette domain-containing protein [Latilactobacillus curvatus]|uniref:ABC transporter ATP-binding protein/permease n=1 Tax=Latilactobacillus curvatus TaxID=28038 RepID=UPI0039AF8DD0